MFGLPQLGGFAAIIALNTHVLRYVRRQQMSLYVTVTMETRA